ncbi:exported protein of unknown function [Nitrosotalea devaniterrae]|uniref:Uncharacterized protein n=1 Tax=Nitrosotalea devaniterrae TaxID=1078905 RepID=A0A128A480_9ARCH|nr:exported protein of unknown function [Candidatus Nitrosotalea devanaterra]
MQTRLQYAALIACAMMVLPSAAFADSDNKSQYATKQLPVQLASMTCSNAYLDGYLGDVVTAINNSTTTATLSTDITKTSTDFGTLQSDASANNTAQFRTDVKTYNADSKTANLEAHSELKIVHSRTVNTTLKSDASQLRSTENTCLFVAKQQKANLKGEMYDHVMARAQNMTEKMQKRGMNTDEINKVIGNATAKIQAFELAVQNAQNSTQIKAALDSFCLYNGCKTSENFHFAAASAIQVDQARLNVLAVKNSTTSYQALVNQAQLDLGNAQTALNQVGSNKYQGTQSSDIWNDIKAAADVIHQLQQIANHKH